MKFSTIVLGLAFFAISSFFILWVIPNERIKSDARAVCEHGGGRFFEQGRGTDFICLSPNALIESSP